MTEDYSFYEALKKYDLTDYLDPSSSLPSVDSGFIAEIISNSLENVLSSRSSRFSIPSTILRLGFRSTSFQLIQFTYLVAQFRRQPSICVEL